MLCSDLESSVNCDKGEERSCGCNIVKVPESHYLFLSWSVLPITGLKGALPHSVVL